MSTPTYRLAVLSDIHGNMQALDAVLCTIERQRVDGILVAGDLTPGAYLNETARVLREREAIAIRGNSDEGILAYLDGTAPEHTRIYRQFEMTRWAACHINAETIAYLRTLPAVRVVRLPGADPIRIMHGSVRANNDGIHPDQPGMLDEIFELVDEPVLVFGHTHEPWLVHQCDRVALNPGAVCTPLNGQVGAQFALIEWNGKRWKAALYCVPYDLQAYQQSFIDSGFIEAGSLARAFLISNMTGHDVARDFLTFAQNIADKAGKGDLPYFSDEIWEEAGQNFPWGKWEETV